MPPVRGPVIGAVLVLVAGCGSDPDPAAIGDNNNKGVELPTAATLGEQAVLSAAEYAATAPYATADIANGERHAQICRACHTFAAGGINTIGPNLHGFFGNEAGAVEGFDYSRALQDANFVWTPRALDAWLAQPGRFLPGNRMTFAGVFDAGDRNDLIAYLLEATEE